MLRQFYLGLLALVLTPASYGDNTNEDLQKQVDQLSQQVQALQEQMRRARSDKNAHDHAAVDDALRRTKAQALVDLDPEQHRSINDHGDAHVLSNPWWRNFDFSGFAAVGYYDTGAAGTRDKGSFEIKEASLFVTANVWNNTDFFLELQTNRLGKDDDKFTRTGEVYVHLHEIPITDSVSVGMKIGRIDIPFGEEYLWQDAIDNPLITNSASYPYGWDEGVLVYGDLRGVNWIFSITDGTDARSEDDNSDKAINLKIYGSPTNALDLSLSLMSNGDAGKSAIEFGGSHFRPLGASYQSSLGASSSMQVNAYLFEANARYDFGATGNGPYVALSLGAANTDDNDPSFERDFRWFSIEPAIQFKNDWYATLRYSEIGTYDRDQGHHFDGKTFAGGNAAFGYDTKRFQRLAFGLGWTPNPRIRAKIEIGKDRFELIDGSPLAPNNGDRAFVGFEVAVGF